MIIQVDWATFKMKFFNLQNIYILENEFEWKFYTSQGPFTIKCIVEKKEDQTENMMFIDRYINGTTNVIFALDVEDEQEDEQEDEEEEEEIETPQDLDDVELKSKGKQK